MQMEKLLTAGHDQVKMNIEDTSHERMPVDREPTRASLHIFSVLCKSDTVVFRVQFIRQAVCDLHSLAGTGGLRMLR